MHSIRPLSDLRIGRGAEYEASVRKLGVSASARITITDYEPNSILAFESKSQIITETLWRFRQLNDNSTEINTTVNRRFPWGPVGVAFGAVISPVLAMAEVKSEQALRQKLELA
ncbi:Uncharacterised protein [Mycobacteroides abscessus subsp. massiliense]|nr:Uncharacterised protein [Mycobacteroides abscessus subsp. massiliense]